jgi:hypothetical protein
MTADDVDPIDVHGLDDDELAAALRAGMVSSDWAEQAAVDLLIRNRAWLGRYELRRAIETVVCDGQLCAWVIWPEVDLNTPASSGELRILALARSLGGIASERSLADLLTSLDETNTVRVLRAVSIACRGRERLVCGMGGLGEGVS